MRIDRGSHVGNPVKIETSVTRLDNDGELVRKTIKLRTFSSEFHPLQNQSDNRA